ncbi:alpha-hydroxyacid dehydrogenase FMN-dependent L-lactate dehydrogenase [Firmicutes bacterium CAG:534]|nr:alpha-hydroxyacid dehydrogenase FMN-dependent L-lactate dehydrogenase [Firmicutes bacterium CAG:534]
MSSKSDSSQITRDYFDSILLETRYWDSDLPSTEMELYGETFETPIMTAALSHLHEICDNAMAEFGKGAKDAEKCVGADEYHGKNRSKVLKGD